MNTCIPDLTNLTNLIPLRVQLPPRHFVLFWVRYLRTLVRSGTGTSTDEHVHVFDAQVPKDHNPPFFWNFTYRLQVSIFFVDSALFFAFTRGIAARYLLPPSLSLGEPLGEENVVD